MSIKAQLAKAKKNTALFNKLKELALNDGKINYALIIEKKIIDNKIKVQELTKQLEEERKKESWFAFLAK